MTIINSQKVIPFPSSSSPLGILPDLLYFSSPSTLETPTFHDEIIKKYQLQNNMRSTLQAHTKEFSNGLKCLRTRITSKVSINKSKNNKSFYGGLKICGLKWICPCCAHKIQQQRRIEIAKAFHYAYSNGYKVIMVTLTFPHKKANKLKDLLAKQALAFKVLRAGGNMTKFKKEHNFKGFIRSLEITHGSNGFHPHTHEAWIVDKDSDADTIKSWILNAWSNSCETAGIIPASPSDKQIEDFRTHAVHVLDNCQSSDYLAKQADADSWTSEEHKNWGIDKELACASTKLGKQSGKTGFQLLDENTSKSRTAFIEYAYATKGKNQLLWSPGLQDKVGIPNKKDKELAESNEDKYSTLALLDSTHWDIILAEKARAEILIIAKTQGIQGLINWFADKGHILTAPTMLDIIQNDCITKHIRQRKTTSIEEYYDLLQANDVQKEKWLDTSYELTSNQPISSPNILLQT